MSSVPVRITPKRAPHSFDAPSKKEGISYGSIQNTDENVARYMSTKSHDEQGARSFFTAADDVLPEWTESVVRLKYGSYIVGFLTFFVTFTMCIDMSWWRNWGIDWIQWAQRDMSDAGGHAWTALTYFGEDIPEFIAIIIFMGWDYGVGMRVCVLLSLVIYCNAVLKTGFHDCRPYWYTGALAAGGSTDVDIIAVCTRTWGFPATHASITASFYPFIAWEVYHIVFSRKASSLGGDFRQRRSYDLRETWQRGLVFIVLGTIILMVGISRSVLGTHFPYQVIVGWLMGGTILQVYLQYSPHIRDIEVSSGDMTARRLDRLRQSNLLNIVVGPLICASIPIIVYHFVASTWTAPKVWNENAHITCTQEDFEMDRSSAFIEAICGATMYAMLCSIAYWRDTFYTFDTNQGSYGERFGRALVGMFMVCVRSVFIKVAQGISGVPVKALGMVLAIMLGNLFMFAVSPLLSVQFGLLDRPGGAVSAAEGRSEWEREREAMIPAESRNGESPDLMRQADTYTLNSARTTTSSTMLSPHVSSKPPRTAL